MNACTLWSKVIFLSSGETLTLALMTSSKRVIEDEGFFFLLFRIYLPAYFQFFAYFNFIFFINLLTDSKLARWWLFFIKDLLIFIKFMHFFSKYPRDNYLKCFCLLILCLDKTFIPSYLALFMASKTKTASFHDFIRTLFLVLLLRFWLQNQNGKFLCLHKTFVPDSFVWFMAIKFEKGILWDLMETFFLVLLLRSWLQNPKPELSMTS